MIIANGKIQKKAYCSHCFSIIHWDDPKDETTKNGHRMIHCPVCGHDEDIDDDAIITETSYEDNPTTYINGVAYTSVEAGDVLRIQEDLTIESAKLNSIILDLDGNTLTLSKETLIPEGNCMIMNGKIIGAGDFDCIGTKAGSYLTLSNVTIESKKNGITAKGGMLSVDNCIITAQKAGILGGGVSRIFINGSDITSKDDGSIVTDSAETAGNNIIVINGATLNGNRETENYLPVAVYIANNDIVKFNKGTINVSNGSGIVVRGGSVTVNDEDVVFNITGDDSMTGYIEDTKNKIPAGKKIVVDKKANYPRANTISVDANEKDIYVIE